MQETVGESNNSFTRRDSIIKSQGNQSKAGGAKDSAVRVFVRVRPLTEKEIHRGDTYPTVKLQGGETTASILTLDPTKDFRPKDLYSFEKCFWSVQPEYSTFPPPPTSASSGTNSPNTNTGTTPFRRMNSSVTSGGLTPPPKHSSLASNSSTVTPLKFSRQSSESTPPPPVYGGTTAAPSVATQRHVYESVGKHVVCNAIEGYNGCIFAYGQTGSGKTHTMIGDVKNCLQLLGHPSTAKFSRTSSNNSGTHTPDQPRSPTCGVPLNNGKGVTSINAEGDNFFSAHEDGPGLIPRVGEDLFLSLEEKKRLDPDSCQAYRVEASFMEIYNEKVLDLLKEQPGNQTFLESMQAQDLRVRNDALTGTFVEGLSARVVNDVGELVALIQQGAASRTTSSTKMNERSSRSHAILSLTVTMTSVKKPAALLSGRSSPAAETAEDSESISSSLNVGASTNTATSESVQVSSKLHMVDLAGCERTSQSLVEGIHFKEATKINLSLTTLGRVIDALADRNGAGVSTGRPPYRESTLTYLLMDSLGGNSKTTMIATLSPAACNFDEAVNTLRYANRARQIVNVVVVNEDPAMKKISELQLQVDKLKKQLASAQSGAPLSARGGPTSARFSGHHSLMEGGIQDLEKQLDFQKSLVADLRLEGNRVKKDLVAKSKEVEFLQTKLHGRGVVETNTPSESSISGGAGSRVRRMDSLNSATSAQSTGASSTCTSAGGNSTTSINPSNSAALMRMNSTKDLELSKMKAKEQEYLHKIAMLEEQLESTSPVFPMDEASTTSADGGGSSTVFEEECEGVAPKSLILTTPEPKGKKLGVANNAKFTRTATSPSLSSATSGTAPAPKTPAGKSGTAPRTPVGGKSFKRTTSTSGTLTGGASPRTPVHDGQQTPRRAAASSMEYDELAAKYKIAIKAAEDANNRTLSAQEKAKKEVAATKQSYEEKLKKANLRSQDFLGEQLLRDHSKEMEKMAKKFEKEVAADLKKQLLDIESLTSGLQMARNKFASDAITLFEESVSTVSRNEQDELTAIVEEFSLIPSLLQEKNRLLTENQSLHAEEISIRDTNISKLDEKLRLREKANQELKDCFKRQGSSLADTKALLETSRLEWDQERDQLQELAKSRKKVLDDSEKKLSEILKILETERIDHKSSLALIQEEHETEIERHRQASATEIEQKETAVIAEKTALVSRLEDDHHKALITAQKAAQTAAKEEIQSVRVKLSADFKADLDLKLQAADEAHAKELARVEEDLRIATAELENLPKKMMQEAQERELELKHQHHDVVSQLQERLASDKSLALLEKEEQMKKQILAMEESFQQQTQELKSSHSAQLTSLSEEFELEKQSLEKDHLKVVEALKKQHIEDLEGRSKMVSDCLVSKHLKQAEEVEQIHEAALSRLSEELNQKFSEKITEVQSEKTRLENSLRAEHTAAMDALKVKLDNERVEAVDAAVNELQDSFDKIRHDVKDELSQAKTVHDQEVACLRAEQEEVLKTEQEQRDRAIATLEKKYSEAEIRADDLAATNSHIEIRLRELQASSSTEREALEARVETLLQEKEQQEVAYQSSLTNERQRLCDQLAEVTAQQERDTSTHYMVVMDEWNAKREADLMLAEETHREVLYYSHSETFATLSSLWSTSTASLARGENSISQLHQSHSEALNDIKRELDERHKSTTEDLVEQLEAEKLAAIEATSSQMRKEHEEILTEKLLSLEVKLTAEAETVLGSEVDRLKSQLEVQHSEQLRTSLEAERKVHADNFTELLEKQKLEMEEALRSQEVHIRTELADRHTEEILQQTQKFEVEREVLKKRHLNALTELENSLKTEAENAQKSATEEARTEAETIFSHRLQSEMSLLNEQHREILHQREQGHQEALLLLSSKLDEQHQVDTLSKLDTMNAHLTSALEQMNYLISETSDSQLQQYHEALNQEMSLFFSSRLTAVKEEGTSHVQLVEALAKCSDHECRARALIRDEYSDASFFLQQQIAVGSSIILIEAAKKAASQGGEELVIEQQEYQRQTLALIEEENEQRLLAIVHAESSQRAVITRSFLGWLRVRSSDDLKACHADHFSQTLLSQYVELGSDRLSTSRDAIESWRSRDLAMIAFSTSSVRAEDERLQLKGLICTLNSALEDKDADLDAARDELSLQEVKRKAAEEQWKSVAEEEKISRRKAEERARALQLTLDEINIARLEQELALMDPQGSSTGDHHHTGGTPSLGNSMTSYQENVLGSPNPLPPPGFSSARGGFNNLNVNTETQNIGVSSGNSSSNPPQGGIKKGSWLQWAFSAGSASAATEQH